MHPKILPLLQSGTEANISLALELLDTEEDHSYKAEFLNLYQFLIFNSEAETLRTEWDLQLRTIFSTKELWIRHQALSALPSNFALMTQLEILGLDCNNFEDFPKEICQLKHLKRLDLNDNRISELSEEIKQLQNLEYMDLSDNKLKEVADVLGSLTKLQILKLEGNPIPLAEQERLQKQLNDCQIFF